MKRLLVQMMVVALGLCSANASLEPGTPMVPLPPSAPSFLILPGLASGGNVGTPFPFQVVAGDLVLLQSSTGGTGSENWSEVVQFKNVGSPGSEHGVAILYTMQDWTGFVLGANVAYLSDDGSDQFTSYTPAASQTAHLFSSGAGFQALGLPNNPVGNSVTYLVSRATAVAVPEPSTVLAGVLLLLPMGASAYRIIRTRKTGAV